MFNKNKKTKSNPFGDKNYKMKSEYNADSLIVARFARISSEVTEFGPMIEITQQKYIFEKTIKGKEITCREIFTGFIAEDNSKYFDLPYIIEPQSFTDYFPETKGTKIPKLSLIWAQNNINYSKKDTSKKKTKENNISKK